jgi:hypothetical protein
MPAPRQPRTPQVRPGEPLTFMRALVQRMEWPPTLIPHTHQDVPPAMPYIVLQADAVDDGTRPIDPKRATHSGAIEIHDAAGALVDHPAPGRAYTLLATVRNFGAAAAYAGVAVFFVGDEAFGIEGFVGPVGESVTVTCRRAWMPSDATAAARPIVVCAYDALLDRPTNHSAPAEDRHVGWRELLADFSGTWNGRAFDDNMRGEDGWLYRVVVEQAGTTVVVSIYEEVADVDAPPPAIPRLLAPGPAPPAGPVGLKGGHAPTLPREPQLRGSATIVGGRVDLQLVGLNGIPPVPFTNDAVTLTLTGGDTLHVTQHETFVDPNDPRGPTDFSADLTH